ncbi:MAG: tRNA (adenosine(37)-N6)-threonylcarbamoyltransferase complex transferase subunit TsaD [Candidatus Kapabacteria bacterium]|nr:tRNA (adenosine(37)-N6)-threonylcarbamoyltransferase complex transferase subunit TsaD [Ignavibacteriota bacterium]MCW5885836.1 tRNA (adenosine(37)-N6)-threonylcarbamoyltransferase complex transferase subunit TsaD [Candidatus Kapabacteria bacterium]
MILAIESSCDETSAAVVSNSEVFSNIISSQYFHTKYGGVVPELASRAHLQAVSAITREALENANCSIDNINAIAVTNQPGLAGSLLVGSNFAKGLSLRYDLPVVPVNHIEGHLFSGCLQDSTLEFPFIALVVSGGHTALFYVKSYRDYEIIGLTKDDAAGEAFDKIAKLMGLPYPGGPIIDKMAKTGNPTAYTFPRPMIHDDNFDFSFSGLKTSVRYFIHKELNGQIDDNIAYDLAASVQSAIVNVLVHKTIKAAKKFKVSSVVIAGGVSANSGLREKLDFETQKIYIRMIAPDIMYCVDNAAMIGFIGEKKYNEEPESFKRLDFTVNSTALRAKK